MLFQSKTAKTKSKVLRNAKLPKDLDMSATVGPKGSYREEHVVAYLERWLQPWSEERQAAGDWRLMYMDAYKVHLTDRIQELCWSRGYVLLYHYGLTTGIAQVNDTDLHGESSRIFQEFELACFARQQLDDPSDISLSIQQVLSIYMSIYLSIDR